MGIKVVGEMAKSLGDSPARYLSQLFILMRMRDGFERLMNCKAVGCRYCGGRGESVGRAGCWINFILKSTN